MTSRKKKLKLNEEGGVIEESTPVKVEGSKKSKELKQAAAIEARNQESIAKSIQEKAAALTPQTHMNLFTAPVNNMDAKAQQFFNLQRDIILK